MALNEKLKHWQRDLAATAAATIMAAIAALPIVAQSHSGTLPLVRVSTADGQDVTSKEKYVEATATIDPLSTGAEAMDEQTLQIKGHGNWTFIGFDKKPFRLKFTSKVKPLGFKSNKHFILMAGADDNLGFLRNIVGYELSRRMGLSFTTAASPVELYLNDDYRGLYMLTEQVRVGKDRVNITEQADEETDPDNVTGGWLVEIDNYDTDPHINVKMGEKDMILTYKSPEVLSAAQEEYLQSQWDAIAAALCSTDENDREWEEMIDIESLARVFIVRELLQDEEGFHGSCYISKERGTDTKWTFGPVWDFGNAYQQRNLQKYTFVEPEFTCYVIDEAWKFTHFRETVASLWRDFYKEGYPSMRAYIESFATSIKEAAAKDHERWKSSSNVCTAPDEDAKADEFISLFEAKAQWLQGQWGNSVVPGDVTIFVYSATGETPYLFSWGNASNGEWPGSPMTETQTIGDSTFYKATFPAGTNIIFNLGSSATQTEDILNVTQDTYYYFYQATPTTGNKDGRYTDITEMMKRGDGSPLVTPSVDVKANTTYDLTGRPVKRAGRGMFIENRRLRVVR